MAETRPPVADLHPLTFGEVLDGSFRLLRLNLVPILRLTAAVVVPVQLLASYLQRDQLSVGITGVLNDPLLAEAVLRGQSPGGVVGASLVSLLTAGVVVPVLAGALALIGVSTMLGRPVGAAEAATTAWRRAGALIGAWWLHVLLLAVPALPALLLGLLVAGTAAGPGAAAALLLVAAPLGALGVLAAMPFLLPVTPAVVTEGIGPVDAVRRSARLVRRRYWPVLGALLGTSLVFLIVAGLLSALPSGLGTGVGGDFAWVLVAAGSVVSQCLVIPLTALAAALIYLDLRMRVEGLDLSLRAQRIAAGGPPGP